MYQLSMVSFSAADCLKDKNFSHCLHVHDHLDYTETGIDGPIVSLIYPKSSMDGTLQAFTAPKYYTKQAFKKCGHDSPVTLDYCQSTS